MDAQGPNSVHALAAAAAVHVVAVRVVVQQLVRQKQVAAGWDMLSGQRIREPLHRADIPGFALRRHHHGAQETGTQLREYCRCHWLQPASHTLCCCAERERDREREQSQFRWRVETVGNHKKQTEIQCVFMRKDTMNQRLCHHEIWCIGSKCL